MPERGDRGGGSVGHEIDPARCTECVGFHSAEQCAAVCPVDCCVPDVERVERESELFERALKLHPTRRCELELGPATSRFRAAGDPIDGVAQRSTDPEARPSWRRRGPT